MSTNPKLASAPLRRAGTAKARRRVQPVDRTIELDPGALIETSQTLADRIQSRFPQANLCSQADALLALTYRAQFRADEITRPIWLIRAPIMLLALAVVAGIAVVPLDLNADTSQRDLFEWLQIIEAGINDIVLFGAGIFFLITLEGRIKRRQSLRELHQVRSFAHVIDMHQLTKDPHRVIGGTAERERSEIDVELTPFELGRYLDYCSELLAIAGKVAALYVQQFDDRVVLETVNEIETLTTGLSRKTWQKLMVLYEAYPEAVLSGSTGPASQSPTSSPPT